VFVDHRLQRESLVIHRTTGEISLHQPKPVSNETLLVVHGIFGIISLLGGDYLITIMAKQKVAIINGHEIYKLTGFKVFPISVPYYKPQATEIKYTFHLIPEMTKLIYQ
jgi:hypothetical protein